nr:flavin reductase (NADPH)-like [Ciona intestinalis]|eukprot:XP_002128791.1 flavin reductase (NADPH)-like [Ciona intestinalis]
MKNLIVFGGTGRSGLAVLEQAADELDIQVTAFVRTPTKIPGHVRSKILVVQGDVLKKEEVSDAIKGKDAVISCLGNGFSLMPTTVISRGIGNIIEGMRENNVKQIVVVGVAFLLPNGYFTPFFMKGIVNDHARMINILKKAKDLDWVIVAPPEISDQPFTNEYTTTLNKNAPEYVVSTQDLAHWLLRCIKDDKLMNESCHQMVGISSKLPLKNWLSTTSGISTLVIVALLVISIYYFTV